MEIPPNITREHLLKAIEKIDREGIPSDADSQYYDVVYNGKRYPPKVMVSYANLFANGQPLDRTTFRGGQGTPGFRLLEKHGFTIELKNMAFYKELKTFIKLANDEELKWRKDFPDDYQGLKIKVGLGQTNAAHVPYISFLGEGQRTSEGIYPVYLYYKRLKRLILAYGVSETKPPALQWNVKAPTVQEYFDDHNLGDADPYPISYVYKVYDLKYALNEQEVNKDLNALIGIYKKILPQQGAAQPKPARGGKFDYTQFVTSATAAGLFTSDTQCLRFIASLLAKPFVIFTGLSGSGKTKLAQAFAKWMCADEKQYRIIPVGADWTNRDPLLGFQNALNAKEYIKPGNGALDLILEAAKEANANKPYFLILDEMNLSHVERYFADFLSTMESEGTIQLHSGDENEIGFAASIALPKNLFIVGTVNIDETTYMFSPKVLDRASVIEFRISADEMESYLKSGVRMDLKKLDGAGAGMAASFMALANDKDMKNRHEKELKETLLKFFNELKKTGAEFGYRSAAEMNRFAAVAGTLNPSWAVTDVMDAVIMQKLLPKVHGGRRKLEPVLRKLAELCLNDAAAFDTYIKSGAEAVDKAQIKYPISFRKVMSMYRSLLDNGFASYAE